MGREEGPGEGLTGDSRLGMLGTLAMLGDLSRLGMLLRNFSIAGGAGSKQYKWESQHGVHIHRSGECVRRNLDQG